MASKVESHGLCGLVAQWLIKFQPPPPPPPPLPNLPNDIVYNILLLLPVKSLARFRCVSKEWNNLLTGSDFIKKHLEDYGQHRLIVSSLKSHMSMDLEEPHNVVMTNIDFPWKKLVHVIMGSCNGLLCVYVDHRYVFLWNPTTRDLKQLPPPSSWWQLQPPSSCIQEDLILYGFGYDMSFDGYYNYKVVRGESYYNITGYDIRVEVYSRKTNSWRRIQDFPYNNIIFQARGIFVNGFLHWLAIGDCGPTVASLDLAKGEFGEVMLPDFEQPSLFLDLGFLNGMLCVMCPNTIAWDVNAMKEYGVQESWIILVTIPFFVWTITMPFAWPTITMPLYLMKNGELVMQISENKMLIYDPRKETLKKLVDTKFVIKSITYVGVLNHRKGGRHRLATTTIKNKVIRVSYCLF